MAPAKTSSPYSVHPGVAQIKKWVQEMPQKTGRSLDEWLALIRKSGPPTEKERIAWLKSEHKLGTNSAAWIAGRLEGKNTEEDSPEAYLKQAEEWVEAQYAGPRAALRPLYEQLLKLGFSINKDVKACPCKTMVPFYRQHVFGQIKPSTNTRIDFGPGPRQHESPQATDQHGRLREERPHHPPHRSEVQGRHRR